MNKIKVFFVLLLSLVFVATAYLYFSSEKKMVQGQLGEIFNPSSKPQKNNFFKENDGDVFSSRAEVNKSNFFLKEHKKVAHPIRKTSPDIFRSLASTIKIQRRPFSVLFVFDSNLFSTALQYLDLEDDFSEAYLFDLVYGGVVGGASVNPEEKEMFKKAAPVFGAFKIKGDGDIFCSELVEVLKGYKSISVKKIYKPFLIYQVTTKKNVWFLRPYSDMIFVAQSPAALKFFFDPNGGYDNGWYDLVAGGTVARNPFFYGAAEYLSPSALKSKFSSSALLKAKKALKKVPFWGDYITLPKEQKKLKAFDKSFRVDLEAYETDVGLEVSFKLVSPPQKKQTAPFTLLGKFDSPFFTFDFFPVLMKEAEKISPVAAKKVPPFAKEVFFTSGNGFPLAYYGKISDLSDIGLAAVKKAMASFESTGIPGCKILRVNVPYLWPLVDSSARVCLEGRNLEVWSSRCPRTWVPSLGAHRTGLGYAYLDAREISRVFSIVSFLSSDSEDLGSLSKVKRLYMFAPDTATLYLGAFLR